MYSEGPVYGNLYGTPPSLNTDFTQQNIPSPWTFSRASTATGFVSGNLQTFSSGAPRFVDGGLLLEYPGTNYIRNPRGEGIVGTGFPTNWSNWGNSQLVWTFVGSGTENGIPYVDVRVAGTYASGNTTFVFETIPNAAPVTPGVGIYVNISAYFKIVGGTTNRITAAQFGYMLYDASQVQLSTPFGGNFLLQIPTSGPLSQFRPIGSYSPSVANQVYCRPGFQIIATAGAVDITFRIGAPQQEIGYRHVTTPILPPVGSAFSAPNTRAGDSLLVTNLAAMGYNAAASTLVAEWYPAQPALLNTYLCPAAVFDDGTIHNYIGITRLANPSFPVQYNSVSSDVMIYNSGCGTRPNWQAMRTAFSFSTPYSNHCANGVDGGAGSTGDGAGTVFPTVTELSICNPIYNVVAGVGKPASTMDAFGFIIRSVQYYPRTMSGAELMDITAQMSANDVPPPAFDLQITPASVLPAGVTWSRAAISNGFVNGVLTAFPSGTPAFCDNGWLLQPASNNQVRNPRAEGAVVGTPGTLPTFWTKTNSAGLSWNVVGIGTDSGMSYIDIRLVGTPTNTAANWITFEPTITFVTGDAGMAATYVKIVGGSNANLGSYYCIFAVTPAGNQYASRQPDAVNPLIRQRCGGGIFSAPANVTSANYGFRAAVTATGVPVDCTFRFACPQVERNSVALCSTPILPPAGTPAVSSRAADDLCYFDGIQNSWYDAVNGAGTIYIEYCFPLGSGFGVFGNSGVLRDTAVFTALSGLLPSLQIANLSIYCNMWLAGVNEQTVQPGAANQFGTAGTILSETIIKEAITFNPAGYGSSITSYLAGCVNGGSVIQSSMVGNLGSGLRQVSRLSLLDTSYIPAASPYVGGGSNSVPILIKKWRYWPQVFTPQQLQGMTAT